MLGIRPRLLAARACTVSAKPGLTRTSRDFAKEQLARACFKEPCPACSAVWEPGSPGQGAIAITTRAGDSAIQAFLAPVLDAATGVALAAERAFLRVLDGSCKTPIGANARVEAGNVAFHAIVLKPDGSRVFETETSGPSAEAASLGETAGQELAAQIPADFFEP